MDSYIVIVGENAETKAERLAEYFGTRVIDGTSVLANREIEKRICMSDDDELAEVCQELTNALGIVFVIEDFEF